MSRVGFKKIEIKRTNAGETYSISTVYKNVTSSSFIKNPFEKVYIQLTQAPLLGLESNGEHFHAEPSDLDKASMNVIVRSKIIKEQINTLSKMTKEAERKIEMPKSSNKNDKSKSSAMFLNDSNTLNGKCLSFYFYVNFFL